MKKIIQILATILQVLAVVSYIGIIKIGVAWENGDSDLNTFIIVIIFAVVAQTFSMWLKNKYPEEVSNAEDALFKKRSYSKNPLFIKILLVIPVTFVILVVVAAIYTLVEYLFNK